jgi:hypothetical protein
MEMRGMGGGVLIWTCFILTENKKNLSYFRTVPKLHFLFLPVGPEPPDKVALLVSNANFSSGFRR